LLTFSASGISGLSFRYLPRCIYNGEVIWCAQDGVLPLLRHAGSQVQTYGLGVQTWKMVNGKTAIEGGTLSNSLTLLQKGQFLAAGFPGTVGVSQNPLICARVLTSTGTGSSTTISLDGFRNYSLATDSALRTSGEMTSIGVAWPAVAIHSTGTISRTSSVANTSSIWTATEAQLAQAVTPGPVTTKTFMNDALLVLNNTAGGPHRIGSISAMNTSTGVMSVDAELDAQTNAAYRIMRRLPFKDAQVYKGSLFGTGVKQYPNRVYVAPPGWNMSLPPGGTDPFDPVAPCGWTSTAVTGFTDLSDFTLSFYDVPSQYDGSDVVALLPTSGPMLVLKSDAVYGMFGSWPTFDVQMVANGAGCIDIRSAVSIAGNAYWAGSEGIYTYRGGQVQNLTSGRIEREWRSLVSAFSPATSTVSMGVVSGHLFVSIRGLTAGIATGAINGSSGTAPTSRTYCYHIPTGTWTGTFGNLTSSYMWSNQVAGEADSLLAETGQSTGRVIDIAPTVTGIRTYTQVSPRETQALQAASVSDGSTSSFPDIEAWTGSALAQATGIEGESRFCDLTVHATLTDTTSPTTTIVATTVHTGSLFEAAAASKIAGTITATTTTTPIRRKFLVNRTGRLHQVQLIRGVSNTTNTKSDIPEIVMSFRDSRRAT
jgi:hypothetical protein